MPIVWVGKGWKPIRNQRCDGKGGNIVLARFPHASGGRGKKRPVLVIQDDSYNATLRHVVVAEITTNLSTASDPASLLIDVSTPDGQRAGLAQNSLVTCLHLATMIADRLERPIGSLSSVMML
jgi:mRNA-degrading endonuclease toxin of MazEF toxin-antitoxin module